MHLRAQAGYLWDELSSASVPLRMSTSSSKGGDAARRKLLRKARLNATHDFSLTHGSLPPKIVLWSRIMLASEAELSERRSLSALSDAPLSRETEAEV